MTITEFRRDAAGIIGDAVASGAPVFVTQHGCVTAVLLSRERYECLLQWAALVELETAGGGDPLPAADAEDRSATARAEDRSAAARAGARSAAARGEDRSTAARAGARSATARAEDRSAAARAGARSAAARAEDRSAAALVETQFGLVDPATADFLKTEGF